MSGFLRFIPCGDRCLMTYVEGVGEHRVANLVRFLDQTPRPAIVEITPGENCFLIEYDPVRIRREQLEDLVMEAAAAAGGADAAPSAAEIVIPPTPALPTYSEGETGLRILNPGYLTTPQDLGRRGYMRSGIAVSGAADFWSFMVGNWLVGNRARAGALEITQTGPEVEFTGPVAFCVTGAPIPAELIPAAGGPAIPIEGWTTCLASPGDRLRLGSTTAGCRSYLCVSGGLDLPLYLGSLSEDLYTPAGLFGRPLQAGDWLPVGLPLNPPANIAGRSLPMDMRPVFEGEVTVRVVRGPKHSALPQEELADILGLEYEVQPESDRSDLRLKSIASTERLTTPTPLAVQEPVPPGSLVISQGQPTLLLVNRDPFGSAPVLAVAVYPDLAAASQLRPGDKLRFQEVDPEEAHAIAWTAKRRLAEVRRHLEREIVRKRELIVQESLQATPDETAHPSPEPASQQAAVPAPSAAPGPENKSSRTMRITIGSIEFLAEVEEVTAE